MQDLEKYAVACTVYPPKRITDLLEMETASLYVKHVCI